MKRLYLLILLFIFAGLLYLSENDAISYPLVKQVDASLYSNGLLNKEVERVNAIANYSIEVQLDVEQKLIDAAETITWVNKTAYPTNEIHFHLYPNAYKNDKTEFAKGYNISDTDARTELNIKQFSVDGGKYELIYFQPDIPNLYDSTVAKVILDKQILPGDTVNINFEYSMNIPRSVKRLGYASGRNFFFISQWFPKVGVFEEGKWVCSQYLPYLNFYSDFGNFSVRIKAPKNYTVAATGVETEKIINEETATYLFEQYGVHDFVWLASDKILSRKEVYTRQDGSEVLIQAYVQPEREKYFSRYLKAVRNCLQFFEENMGIYPYQTLSLIDVPRTSGAGGMEYPTLFTVSAELFSPAKTGWPEYLVAHEFSHQYFQGILANNEVYEAWLDEGFASYAATKIMFKYYPGLLEYFRFVTYVPIFGLNFLSYNEIPIIYTMANIPVTEGLKSAVMYYKSPTIGTIADTSSKLPDRISYVVNSYAKPELVLHTMERHLGYEKMIDILRDYYDSYKFKHPQRKDFIAMVQKHCNGEMGWFFEEFVYNSKIFDYKITDVKKNGADEYEVWAERVGDGFFKNEIVLYTEKDTLKQLWESSERWKAFRFKTNDEVVGAEIDPNRKNLLDINFANNSYTVEPKVWGSLSIAIRWFFWVQNALMVLGSIG